VLSRAAAELNARADDIGRLLAREEGKTLAEGIAETRRAAQILSFFAGECLRAQGDRLDSARPGVGVEVTREPLGVVALITPWNFPIAIPAWKTAAALAFGNTVVLKPAEAAPGCARLLVDILQRAGLPGGALNFVNGPGSTVGQALIDDPRVDGVSFTGSQGVGARIAETCARHMRKCQLEMGGKNPLIVLDDADLDVAVDCALDGSFGQTGQRCTASSRLIVTERIYSRFIEKLVDGLRGLKVGDALDPETRIGPVAHESQFQSDLDWIARGRADGGHLRFGGAPAPAATRGLFLTPALFTEAANRAPICREEVFGPVACVIRARNYEDALAVANDTPFGRSGGICTTSLKYAEDFKRNAQVGMAMVNLPTAGVDPHVPFGGRKASSFGQREQGGAAREFFTQLKTAYTRP